MAVADEPRAAVRGGAERGHRPAALAAPVRALRRAAAAGQGAGGRLAAGERQRPLGRRRPDGSRGTAVPGSIESTRVE